MQKSRIEWCDSTWNPVTGCRHDCEYCYARRIAARFGGYDKSDGTITTHNPLPRAELHQPLTITRSNGKTVNSSFPFGFEPTLHIYRLDEPQHRRDAQTIFVCSMADLFGKWVPTSWIRDVLDACQKAPQHRYIFLTKNPARYLELDKMALLPHGDNFWYGSTATNPETDLMAWAEDYHTFVSIEPLLGPFGRPQPGALHDIDWFIIGAETGNRKGKVTPEREWVREVVDYCSASGKPVFMKDSLIPVVGEENMRREFPWPTQERREAGHDAATGAAQDLLAPAT